MYMHEMNIHFRRKAEFLITILITIQKGIGVIRRERQRRSKKLGLKKVMKNTQFQKKSGIFLAGDEGIEPSITVLETAVIPFN